MPDYADTAPALLIKKMGGMVLLIVGFLLAVLGYTNDSNSLATLGVLLLVGGLVLLVLKIFRRNQP
jgi:uncharacterized membrane protein YjjP (DUF1212 family)